MRSASRSKAEVQAEPLGHGEHELPVRKIKKHLVGQVLREQECPLLTARRTQVETLAAERSEIVMATTRIRAWFHPVGRMRATPSW